MLLLLKSAAGGTVAGPTFANLTSGAVASSTTGTTASVSPTGNRLILVTIHTYLSTGSTQSATPSVTGNGITYTLERTQNTDDAGTDRGTMFVFRGMASSPTPGAITITFGLSQTRIFWSVDQSDANVNTSGTNGAGAIVQSTGVTLAAAGTSASVNYPNTMRASSGGFSAWGHQVQEGKTPRSAWTELADNSSLSLAPLETQYIAATDTAGSVTWATSSRGGGVILEIASAPILLAAYSYSGTGTVADDSGNGRSFTLTNSSARTSAGGGYTYGGAQPGTKGISQTTGEVQDGPAITGLNLPARTIETWAKGAGLNDPGWFLEYFRAGTDNTGVFGYLYLSSSFRGRAKNTAGTASDITATPDSANWHHWALVADGKVLRLYKDGTQVGTDQTLTSIWDADNFRIFDGSGNGTFISETRVYDGALSTAQINTDLATPVPGGSSGTSVNAGNAAATGTAQDPARTVSTGSQASTGTGAANAPAASIAGSSAAATGTGTANTTTSQVKPGPSAAAATGAAPAPSPRLTVNASTATGTGAANNATVSTATSTNAAAVTATGSGAAQTPSPKIATGLTAATGSGVGNNATVSTGSSTNAAATTAAASGAANQPTQAVAPGPTAATATGASQAAAATVSPSPATASATGTAQGATGKVAPSPTTANGVGGANTPSIQSGSFTNATASTATGTGAAQQASGKVATTPTPTAGLGVANAPTAGSSISAQAGVASATGTANNTTVTKGASANAGLAAGTGSSTAAKLSVLAAAEAALALAVALNPAAGAFLSGTAHAATMPTPTASPAASTAPSASGAAGAMASAQAGTGAAAQANPGTFTIPTATGG